MYLRYSLVSSATDKHGVRRVVSACRVSPAGARKKVWVWRKQYHMAPANGEPMVVLNDKTRFGTEYEHFPYHTEREAYNAAMAMVPCEAVVPASHYVIVRPALGPKRSVIERGLVGTGSQTASSRSSARFRAPMPIPPGNPRSDEHEEELTGINRPQLDCTANPLALDRASAS